MGIRAVVLLTALTSATAIYAWQSGAMASGPWETASEPHDELRYTDNNKMIRPDNYREWIWLTSGLGMSYSADSGAENPEFDNVFVTPASYKAFCATGKWPDRTIFILENRQSQSKGSINRSGHFQSELDSIEAHVKDERRFKGKWAFYAFGKSKRSAAALPREASCYSCHAQHAAVDTTFVQFYPTLLGIAKAKKTLGKY